jgi:hypothetical protein
MMEERTEPEFVNLLRSPEIDSQPGGPVRQPHLTYRLARIDRLAESIPGFVKNVSKYGPGLQFCSIFFCMNGVFSPVDNIDNIGDQLDSGYVEAVFFL